MNIWFRIPEGFELSEAHIVYRCIHMTFPKKPQEERGVIWMNNNIASMYLIKCGILKCLISIN